ncbi:dual specificity protein kinase splA isoform X22 [Drosophila albomicans]|uniref:Dual specificity protein kinase splA isoform X22 n=1 Tax=Drosophila albomicans TaxID=7291 RepID=A0A9C6SVY1_DROAB|nr:dual specificity protein kinase splA isoform X22 [Drosophila albomicans]
MDLSLERDSSALGSLFQQIINDMKNTSPLWEDFVAKASKLHTCLRAAIQAIAAYLDAFQKIADAATNSRGASKEIGTALTRVCLRHKAVETRLKTFTSAIMDCLVQPLQDKIEDWKRTVATIDKDHAKEYKRCRSELKKRSSDTLRLQKKARKGQTDNSLQSLMDSHMQDVTLRRAELEEVEKKSLRAAMVEERLRYCSFVHMLQPVVHEECEVMSELGHLQEAMESIALVTKEPSVLPQASEELIHDAKASINLYPESPGGGSGSQGGGCSNSLGSRKSSVCSISSMNSSGSSNSPGHHHYQRSLSQFVTPAIRLKPGESSDSGFCSSPALTTQVSNATNQTHAVSTWPPHSQDAVDALPPTADRPHTISTTYEKGHQRPPLTVYTFQNPETIHESNSSGSLIPATVPTGNGSASGQNTPATQKSPAASLSRPPLPVKPAHVRCSSLERPLSAQSNHRQNSGQNLLQRQCPSPIPAHITKGGAGGGGGGAAMGSSTRIARRSSINQAKPPPPVRRSSSVTPSPNNVGQPQHSSNHNSHAYQQQSLSLSNSSEHLPPPPAFLLEATTAYSTSPTPPAAMPSSALKVSETVRALAAMRHQPASPVALRRMHQQQQQQQLQQQQQQSLLQPMHKPSPNDDAEYEAYYNSYMELHAYAQALPPQQQQQQHQQQQLRFAQQHHTSHQTHQHNHHEQLPPTPPPYHGPPQVDAASFRTSSPSGSIYAQPKLVNNMSSFRTSSPSPNGHAHPLPPTQPKANPNLIAQLNARLNSKQQQHQQQQQHVAEGIYGNAGGVGVGGGESIYMRGGNGLSMSQQQQQQQHYDAAAQATANMRQHQQLQQQQQQHYTCPPPLEDPPPPPIYSATMPKKMARPSVGHSNSNNMGNHLVNAYAAASNSATLPKNILQQQRLQQQQQQQHQQQLQQQQLQQQQYQQPTGISVGNGHANQRSPMPLPQQQQHAQQQQQQQQRQPPIPSRHSSVQQKIFVSTNPFIQTTAVKFHSPSSVHSTPAASPTCGSPASSATMASIYGTTARGGAAHHQQQQQQYHHQQQQHQQQQQQQQQHYYRDVAGGNSNGGVYYASHNNAHAHGHSNAHAHANANANVNANANAHTPHMPHVQAHHSNYATSTNIEKTGSIRAKTKAEFLENLNAKLAKQGMSGRAFAVRNLINSKALPDPRICHESLMDQIKRGATLKRNQKINDRSAPKIH